MKNSNLLEAPADVELAVLEINAGRKAKQRLISMGLHVGDKLMKFNDSTWCPVLVKNITLDSTKTAIGKKLAAKIMVTYESA